ncbi:MAG: hypothetical protein JWP35_4064 [Caulobacter sp.]|nr:hypothetical protein [Caulobacter sp.]
MTQARRGRMWLYGAAALVGLGAVCAAPLLAAPAKDRAHAAAAAPGGLIAFQSDAELKAFVARHRARRPVYPMAVMAPPPPAMSVPMPASNAVAADASPALQPRAAPVATAGASITNNQESAVDEGDIVKLSGDTLVILRRGRLFTMNIGGGGMAPVDVINAFPPGVDGSGDWYDEMLVAGDHVVVIGYSYSREGTQINRFRLDGAGHLTFEDAYQLSSGDYYSSRNYASRLVGDRLVFYSPLDVPWEGDPLKGLPSLRKWSGQKGHQGFRRIGSSRQVYVPRGMSDDAQISTLHTVTNCDLTAPVLDCRATSVLGSSSRSFYVSGGAVYVWAEGARAGGDGRGRPASSLLYRLPLDGGRPGAVGVRGMPTDQFSFREDPQDHMLNVLVRSEGGGDAMWRPEFSEGAVALLRLPLAAFGDGSRDASRTDYRPLPSPGGESYNFHNRFAGDYVLYGSGQSWRGTGRGGDRLTAAPLHGGAVTQLSPGHPIDRIELLGGDALVVGGDGDALTFTAIDLAGLRAPRLGDHYSLALASQGEDRSHAFFFRPDADSPDGLDGIMGLPVGRPSRGLHASLFQSSAAMVFLGRHDRRFSGLGELAADDSSAVDDGCVASCVDWYGNARPIFVGGRIFALMGYELIEGRLDGGRITELRRGSFAPRPAVTSR